ncbi:MAG: hypothetical protein GEU73_07570 [Chloroflexi bacterium]|nr:hypothetical protein [Chloroflexota bacterium]
MPRPAITDVLLWLVAIEFVGLAALPLAGRLFAALPDRGYAAAKMLGLIVLAYAAWSTGMLGLTAFTGPTTIVLAVALGAIAWLAWGRVVLPPSDPTAARGWKDARALAIGAEVIFLICFLGGVWIRSHNAAIAGQEKQMDFTFLHTLIQAVQLPAQDLWLAGHALPYYYLGYLTQSLIPKAMAIEPSVAYNLAVAMVFALAAVGAFGLVSGLVRMAGAGLRAALAAGALGAFALTVMGNLQAVIELLLASGIGDHAFWTALGVKNLELTSHGFPPPDGAWWFRAARVIPNIQPDGITEFPYFSFLLGDLHPHYMAIPLGILVALLAVHQVIARPSLTGDRVRLAVTPVVLGAVIAFNTWDVPVFWGLFALATLAAVHAGTSVSWSAVAVRGGELALVFLLSVVLFMPYFIGYISPPLGIGIVADRTDLGTILVLFGPLLVLPVVAGILGVLRDGGSRPGRRRRVPNRWVFALAAVLGIALAVLGEPALGLLVATLLLWLALTWWRAQAGASSVGIATGIMTTVGLGSILLPELLFLQDVFDSRMNTVFKLYYDAWILLALAVPPLTWELVTLLRQDARPGRAAGPVARRATFGRPSVVFRGLAATGLGLAAALAAAGALYPIAATHTKSDAFAGTPTLDGLAYLRATRPDDVAAIDWLRVNDPLARVVEAVGQDYTDAGRFATFAGTPTLVGWVGHELQWRGPRPEIDLRQELARRVYTDLDDIGWRAELDRLGMDYVVVGSLERELYGADVQARIERALPVVHRSGNTAIYGVRPARDLRAAR